MKQIYLLSMLVIQSVVMGIDTMHLPHQSQENVHNEQNETPSSINFDLILCPEYDPDNPEELKPPEKVLIDYIPPRIRTIGFALLVRYIIIHNFVKDRIQRLKAYIGNKLRLMKLYTWETHTS